MQTSAQQRTAWQILSAVSIYHGRRYTVEGDTASFLGLIDNELNAYRRPPLGRPVSLPAAYGETHPIWTQGDDLSRVSLPRTLFSEWMVYCACLITPHLALAKCFSVRLRGKDDWTIADYAHANHSPLAEVNGQAGTAAILIEAEVGQSAVLDASRSQDSDGQSLHTSGFITLKRVEPVRVVPR